MTSFPSLRRLSAVVLLTAAPLALAACGDNDAEVSMGEETTTMEREAEQTGASIGAATENGLENAEQGLENAGQAIEDSAENAADSIEEAAEDAGNAAENGVEEMRADEPAASTAETATAGGENVSTYTYRDGQLEEQAEAAEAEADRMEDAAEQAEERQPQ